MEHATSEKIREVWRQRDVPVLVRQGAGFPVFVKIPNPKIDDLMWRRKAATWLKPTLSSRDAKWLKNARGFEVPKAWFNNLTTKLLQKYQKLWIIQPYREQEVCAPACKTASGHECNCQCMGRYHGIDAPGSGWFTVNEAFETRWGESHMACRLMIRTDARGPNGASAAHF